MTTHNNEMPDQPYVLRDDQIRNLHHVSRPQHRKPARPEAKAASKRLRERIGPLRRETPWHLRPYFPGGDC